MAGRKILPHHGREYHAGHAGLRCRDRVKEWKLLAIQRPSSLNGHRGEERESHVGPSAARHALVHALRLERRALESAERAPQLLVRAPVHAPPHRAQEGVQRE